LLQHSARLTLEIEVAKQLYTKLTTTSTVEENSRVLDRTIRSIRDYFKTPNDSIWCSIQLKLWEIDSLFKYSNNEMGMPDKPVYHRPSFDAPDHLSGYVIPYDGDGVLIGSYPKFYVIEGVEKDMSGYFEGYVTKTDRTTSIYSKANGSTWDATVCEYISTSEYNEAVASYRQEQADATSNYKAEMKEYNSSVSNYKSYKKNAPLIKTKITNLFNSINLSINQLTGKI